MYKLTLTSGVSIINDMVVGYITNHTLATMIGNFLIETDSTDNPEYTGFTVTRHVLDVADHIELPGLPRYD